VSYLFAYTLLPTTAADAALHEFENALDSDAQSNEGGGEDDDGQPQQQEDVVLVDDDDENDFDDDDDESDMPSTNGDRSLLRTGAAAVADMSEEDAVIAIDDDDDGGNEALNNEQEHHQQHLAEVEISGGGGDDEYSVHPPTGVDYSNAGELMVGADIDYAQPDDDHVRNQQVDSVDDQQHPENVMDDFGPTITDEFSALVDSAVHGEHSDAIGSGQSLMISSTGGGDAFDAPPTDFTPIVSISEGDSSHLQRLGKCPLGNCNNNVRAQNRMRQHHRRLTCTIWTATYLCTTQSIRCRSSHQQAAVQPAAYSRSSLTTITTLHS
jgi:hypothetical protein